MKITLVHRVPSSTFHFTLGDSKIYQDFVDRPRRIAYDVQSKRGSYLLDLVLRKGTRKYTVGRTA